MMNKINDYIKYIESTDEPLSSNVFFIEGKENTYIFDVGRNDEAYNEIQNINKNKVVIISHFHGDHISNLERVTYQNLYVSNYTYKHINRGNILKEEITINDDIKLDIIPISSIHSKGSLVLNINNEYCLIGDSIHSDKPIDKSLMCMMIKDLEKIDTKYYVMGHGNDCIYDKQLLINELKQQKIG